MKRLAVLACLLLTPAAAHAACTSPAGAEGQIVYNADNRTHQYCDGTDWIAFAPPEAATNAMPSAGLVGHWKLDESGNVSTAADSAGSNDGTLTNFPADPSANWVSGKLGGALDFDGTNDYVSAGVNTIHNPGTGSLSISYWIKTTDTNANFLSKRNLTVAGDANNEGWVTYILSDKAKFQITNSASGDTHYSVTSASTVNDGNWHHIVVMRDVVSNKLRLYFDGAMEDEAAATTADISSHRPLLFGNQVAFLASNYLQGKLDDVRIYDRALSASEIALLAGAAQCQNPQGSEGTLLFNPDHQVMEFCNGQKWVPLSEPKAASAPAAPESGLVGHWKLDESSGTTAADQTGGNNGALQNGPAWQPSDGKVHGALEFDGVDDYVDLSPHLGNLNFSSAATISGWVKSSQDIGQNLFSISAAATTDYLKVTLGPATGSLTNEIITVQRCVNGYCTSGSGFTKGYVTTDRNSVFDGAFHHIAIVFDGTATRIYLDGSEKAATLGGGTDNGIYGLSSPDRATIGTVFQGGSSGSYFNGKIDDVRLYNRALSAAEVSDLYAAGDRGPVAHWRLDEKSGTVAADSAGNNNGTLTNMDPATDWTPGRLAGALAFDGVDDWVEINSVRDTVAGDLSVTFWMKRPSIAGQQCMLCINDSAGANKLLIFAGGNSINDQAMIYDGGGTPGWEITGSVVADETWHHVVYTKSGSSGTLYVDGSAQGTHTADFSLAANDQWSIAQEFDNASTSDFFSGVLDDVRIYPRALSAGEIAALYEGTAGSCAAPAGTAGTIVYNSACKVYQYCDGARWVGIGKTTGSIPAPTSTGLVGHWPMDSLSMTAWKPAGGQVGGALEFNGEDDYVSPGSAPFSGITDTFTMAFWASPAKTRASTAESTSSNESTTAQSHAIFPRHGDSYPSGHAGAGVSVGTNGISVFEHDGGYFPSLAVHNTALSGWNHVTVVYNNKQPSIYLNGALVRTGLTSSKIVHPSLLLGEDGGFSDYGYYKGLLDDVRIYDQALTPAQISDLYSGTEPAVAPVAHLKLDESSGTTATDSAGSYDGTLVSFETAPDSTANANDGGLANGPAFVSGAKIGGGLQFDGSNDYIAIPNDNASLRFTGNSTVSAWVKLDAGWSSTGKIFRKQSDKSGASEWGIDLSVDSARRPRFAIVHTEGGVHQHSFSSSSVLSTGQWYLVTGVWESPDLKIYIDGVLTDTLNIGTGTLRTGTNTVSSIGIQDPNGTPQGLFNGQIDDVRVYNRALSAAEIADLYYASSGTTGGTCP